MRNCTDREEEFLRDTGRCPFCRSPNSFLSGPSGGMSQNIECSVCGAKFNITGPFTPEVIEEPTKPYMKPAPPPRKRWWQRVSRWLETH